MMLKGFRKRVYGPIMQTWCKFYFKKPRKYQYSNIKGQVLPGVFFPHFTVSTSILIDYVSNLKLEGTNFLELGCGTGLVSVAAAKKGAHVMASDINPKALENVILNAEMNQVKITTIFSNLFESLQDLKFNHIIINPPYYPKKPNNDSERAWYCGQNFEYFQDLFSQVKTYLTNETEAIMILSEDCELQKIQEIAMNKEIELLEIIRVKRKKELNMIFKLRSTKND